MFSLLSVTRVFIFAGYVQSTKHTMKERFISNTTFPQAVCDKSMEAVSFLEDSGFFTNEFNQPDEAMKLLYESLCRSLIPKFIDGSELSWEFEELYAILIDSSVRQSINELEKDGIVHVFDDMVILAEKNQF